MENYLFTLANQLKSHNVAETASLQVIANEGEPAFVQVRDHIGIRTFIQNKELTELILINTIPFQD